MSGAANTFPQAISRLKDKPNGHHPGWLQGLRRSAFQWVSERGFPTSKDEDWKYTRVAPILDIPFEPAEPDVSRWTSSAAIDQAACDLGGPRLVFVNGHFAPELSRLKGLPPGVRITNFASALLEDGSTIEPLLSSSLREHLNGFTALNAALAEDGAFIRLPPGMTVEEPIHLVFLSDTGAVPVVSHPRTLVLAGPGSRATIVESHAGIRGDVYLTNAVTEVVLKEGAVVEHYKLQNETETAFHVGLLSVRQGRGSRFTSHSVALGAAIARHEVRVTLEAPGAEVALNGLYMPRGKQHLDNPTTIEHAAPECTSRELYKGIVDEHGRGVFDGRIVVRPGAMKTDASQTNKNLLLSETAQAHSRPWLEIFADDVKCAHGTSIGQLDEEVLFYLRSRGIEGQAARSLLTYAFAAEMVEVIRLAPLRARVQQMVAARLSDGEMAGLLI